jgi:hypothetical protein
VTAPPKMPDVGPAGRNLLEAPRDAPPDHPVVIAVRRLAEPIADLIAAAGDAQATARAGGQASRALQRVQIAVEELLDRDQADRALRRAQLEVEELLDADDATGGTS